MRLHPHCCTWLRPLTAQIEQAARHPRFISTRPSLMPARRFPPPWTSKKKAHGADRGLYKLRRQDDDYFSWLEIW